MNATTASATTAPTTTAPRTVYIYCFGRRMSTVHYDDMDKIRAYMKKKATQGFTIINICIKKICAFIDIAPTKDHISATPGYQRIKHAWRNIEGEMVETYDLYKPIICSAYGWHYDSVAWAKVHTPITATIQYDAPIGPEHIQTTTTTATTSQTCLNAVEECANICPTAQDAVNIASILDTPIRIITPTHAIEVNWTVCRVEIRRNSRYVRGFIELEDVSFDMDKDGLCISYYEKGINHFDDWFIAWGDIQTITALTSKLDIFRSVKGVN